MAKCAVSPARKYLTQTISVTRSGNRQRLLERALLDFKELCLIPTWPQVFFLKNLLPPPICVELCTMDGTYDLWMVKLQIPFSARSASTSSQPPGKSMSTKLWKAGLKASLTLLCKHVGQALSQNAVLKGSNHVDAESSIQRLNSLEAVNYNQYKLVGFVKNVQATVPGQM